MATTTVQIRGSILGPDGAAPARGSVTCALSQPASATDWATGASVRVGAAATFTLDAGGALPTGAVLVPNDALSPSGTVYLCTFRVVLRNGAPLTWTEKWRLASSPAAIDIGAITRVEAPALATFVAGPAGPAGQSAVALDGSSSVALSAPGFATPGIAGQFGSVVNLGRTVNGSGIQASAVVQTKQVTGGASDSIPVGLVGQAHPTGGTWNHAVGVLGLSEPAMAGDFRSVEGRIDSSIAGVTGMGVLGLTYLSAPDNTGTVHYALVGNALTTNGTGTGTNVGLWAVATGGAVNINATFGAGDAPGDNASVIFRGYRTPAGGAAQVAMSVADSVGAFYVECGDPHINGVMVHLRDTAGASALTVLDQAFGSAFVADSAGRVAVGGKLILPSRPPASSSAAGEAGTVTWDGTFLYVCVAASTWRRVALVTW